MDEMYREVLLDHYRHPRNFGKMISPDISHRDSNPLCGDEVEFFLRLEDDKIKKVMFDGKGCVICMASSSILSDELEDKDINEIQSMTREDMLDLVGVKLTASRVKCAMLPLVCVKKGIINFKGEKK